MLSPLAAKKAAEELGETDELLRTAPDALRKALLVKAEDETVADIKDDLLKSAEASDIFLLRFLRVRKYDTDAAVANVVGWFRWLLVQRNMPTDMLKAIGGTDDASPADDCAELSPWTVKAADVQDVLESNAIEMLPGYTKDGAKAMCISDIAEMLNVMKERGVKRTMFGMNYLLDQASFDPNTQVCPRAAAACRC